MKTHKGSRGIALLFLYTLEGRSGKLHAPVALTLGKRPLSNYEEAGWAPVAGLDGCRKSRPTPLFYHRTIQPEARRYTELSQLTTCAQSNRLYENIHNYMRHASLKTTNSLEIKCQLDATEVFIADLIACSTCFGHHYAHHQELKSIIQ